MRLLAKAMGFDEPWLRQSAEEVIEEILTATAARNPALQGLSLDILKSNGAVPLALGQATPFADLHFPTPSGKVELFSQAMADAGLDPLPGYEPDEQFSMPPARSGVTTSALMLITGAAHHFVTSSFANQASLLQREDAPFVEIHPEDAAARGITDGAAVVVENEWGWCRLVARLTEAVRPGVLASPKGRWAKLDPFRNGQGGRNVNWTTPDVLADMAGQSTFHTNFVWIRPLQPEP
jgi:anaerobic selenocysteine-containing dehydrogenase